MATIRNAPPGTPRLPEAPARTGPHADEVPPLGRSPTPTVGGGVAPLTPQQRQAAVQAPQAQPGRMSAADAERLAQQSGFVRGARPKRRLGLDVDDVTQGPIPLPVDEVDDEAWGQGTMDDALHDLSLHGHQLTELAQGLAAAGPDGPTGGLEALAQALVGGAFMPTGDDLQRLQTLAQRADDSAAGTPPEAAIGSLQALFGLAVDKLPPGPARVAAALVVAGRAAAVVPDADGLRAEPLAEGIGQVLQGGNRSVSDARGMHEGIHRERGHLTTFVPKR